MNNFVKNPGEGTGILSDLTANPSLLFNFVDGKCRKFSAIEGVFSFKPDSVVLPLRLRDLVKSHVLVLEKKSLVSEGARNDIRVQSDVRYMLKHSLGKNN